MINNKYSKKRREVIRLGMEIEKIKVVPQIDEAISWEEFFNACSPDQKELASAYMEKRVKYLKWSGNKRLKIKRELKELLKKYIVNIHLS